MLIIIFIILFLIYKIIKEINNKKNIRNRNFPYIKLIIVIILIIFCIFKNKNTYCNTQKICWKSSSNCDMSCEWKNNSNISCDKCASYCDMKTNTCRCTKITWPNKNPMVDWKTYQSKC